MILILKLLQNFEKYALEYYCKIYCSVWVYMQHKLSNQLPRLSSMYLVFIAHSVLPSSSLHKLILL